MADDLFEAAWRYARVSCPVDATHEDLVRVADGLLTDARMRVLTFDPPGAATTDPPEERHPDAALAS